MSEFLAPIEGSQPSDDEQLENLNNTAYEIFTAMQFKVQEYPDISVFISPDGSIITRKLNDPVPETRLEDPESAIGLAQAARELGTYPQYIYNIIYRYRGVASERTSDFEGQRGSRKFTKEDIHKLRLIMNLEERGNPIHTAVEKAENKSAHEQALVKMFDAFQSWMAFGKVEDKLSMVEVLADNPQLTEQERRVLIMMEGEGSGVIKCANEIGVGTTRHVKELLKSAKQKIGAFLFDMLLIHDSEINS